MAYKLYTVLADSSNHGAKRSTANLKYIVLHYTANTTDTAKANANYFKTGGRNASAHMFVDETSVYRSVNDDVVAWAVGGKKYADCNKTGGGKLYGKVTNSNSISIEMCSTNGEFSIKTLDNAALLVSELMKKYDIGIDNVVRHFDVTGKPCVKYWIGSDKNEAKYSAFKKLVVSKLKTDTPTTEKTSVIYGKVKTKGGTLKLRMTASSIGKVLDSIPNGTKVTILAKGKSWHQIKYKDLIGYVSAKYIDI